MAILALFTNLAFYHVSLLTFVIGAQVYQSFFANITAKNALTGTQFRALQSAIWPMYFKLQIVVSVLLALTYPGGGEKALFRGSSSVSGLFDDRLTVMLPLTLMFVFSTTNAYYLVPKATSVMRKLPIPKDGPTAPGLQASTNKFSNFHLASYACSMAGTVTSIGYALCIADRFL